MSNDEQQQQFVGVREGAAATYLAKSKPSRHSRESGNPAGIAEKWPFDRAAIAQSDKGRRMKQRDYLENGAIPVIDQGQEFIGGYTDDPEMAYDGELPVVLFGDHTRSVKFVDQRFAVGADGIKIFRPAEGLLPKYFYYWMISARLPDRGYGRHYQFLRKLSVSVPTPDEQRRIVAELETQLTRLDASVTALKRVQANLKRYRASVLKAACEGRLVPTEAELARREGRSYESGSDFVERVVRNRRAVWESQPVNARRKKYQEPQAPSGSPTGLPEGWAWGTLDQLSLLDVGFAFKSAEFTNEGIRLLRGENMEPGAFRWAETRHWPESKLQGFEHLLIQEGQIVLAMDRPLISAGLKIARARASDLPCLLVQRMARFRPVLIEMTTFLYQAMQGEAFIKHLLGGQTGTQLPHISGEGIQGFLVQAPPLAEQHRIVAEVERRLSVIEELEATVAANLKRAERLRQAVLSRAFAGGA